VNFRPEHITAVVLAGGFGTRIKHLLRDLPKPMAPVAGRPFVEWVVRYLARQGVRRVILSTGHLADTIATHFATHPVPGVTVSCVQETTPLGTAGGFLNAARSIESPSAAWLVLNGDSLAFLDLAPFAARLADDAIAGAIAALEVPDAARYGTLAIDARSRVTAFTEKRAGRGIINAGVYLFRHAALTHFPEKVPLSFETDVFPALLARRFPIAAHVVRAAFLDIGTPESLPLAENFIRENAGQFV
jgi:NDP-sugar pyrophosphorylase family protein